MIEIKTKLRKWGNSFGIIVPQKQIESLAIKEGEDIRIFINTERTNILRESFNTLKQKKSTSKIIKEMDKELYND